MDLLQMMQCPHCGYTMNSSDKECPRCHASVLTPLSTSAVQLLPPPQPVQPQPAPSNNPASPYVQPPASPSPAATDDTAIWLGFTSFLFGLLGIFLFIIPGAPLVCALIAILCGAFGLKNPQSKGMSVAGITLGAISLFIVIALGTVLMGLFGLTAQGWQYGRQYEAKRVASIKVSNLAASITKRHSSGNTITITGTATNNFENKNEQQIVGTIYNRSNVTLGESTDWVSLRPGETKAFEIVIYDKTRTSPFTYKVRVGQD